VREPARLAAYPRSELPVQALLRALGGRAL